MYNEDLGYAAFRYGETLHSSVLVCIGGLSDGLLSRGYLRRLAKELEQHAVSIVQPVLRSSYKGWGFGRLEEDAEDIDTLLGHLLGRGVSSFLLLGHSAGCRSVVSYFATGKHVSRVQAVILQGPNSERDAMPRRLAEDGGSQLKVKPATSRSTAQGRLKAANAAAFRGFREQAAQMIKSGRGEEAMPRDAAELLVGRSHVVTAYRFQSCTERMGDDDMFSTDLTLTELGNHLGLVAVPVLVVVSAEDECMPLSTDLRSFAERIRQALPCDVIGSVETLLVQDGDHALDLPSAETLFTQGVADFVQRLPRMMRLHWEHGAARKIRELMKGASSGSPVMVALTGMAMVGKTTSAAALRRMLGTHRCLTLNVDGFILSADELKQKKNPVEAVWKRGTYDTFDAAKLRDALLKIKDWHQGEKEVSWPGVDRASGYSVPNGAKFIRQQHSVVIIEGLYLLHDKHGYQGIPSMFDYRIYMEGSVDACIGRVKEKDADVLWTPPGISQGDLCTRVEQVDRPNAYVVKGDSSRADHIVFNGFDPTSTEQERVRKAVEKIQAIWRRSGGHQKNRTLQQQSEDRRAAALKIQAIWRKRALLGFEDRAKEQHDLGLLNMVAGKSTMSA